VITPIVNELVVKAREELKFKGIGHRFIACSLILPTRFQNAKTLNFLCPMPYLISREFTFCYGHRLLNYDGKCSHLHGHNGRVVLTLCSETLDEQGMVHDFSELKDVIDGWIQRVIDHNMVLHKDDPMVPVLQEQEAPLFLMDDNPTAENFARLFFELAQTMNYPVCRVQFWETEKCCAEYSDHHVTTHHS